MFETERLLWQRRFADREATCLVVSNRRAALQQADLVLLLEDGHLVASGSPDHLVARSLAMRELRGRAT